MGQILEMVLTVQNIYLLGWKYLTNIIEVNGIGVIISQIGDHYW